MQAYMTSSKRANISKLRIDHICSPSSRTILPHPWDRRLRSLRQLNQRLWIFAAFGDACLRFTVLLLWRAVRSSAAPLAWGFLIGVLCNCFPTLFLIIFVLGDRQIEKEVLPLWPKRHFNNKDTLIILKEKLWKKQLVMAWTRQAHRSLRAHLHTVEPV